MKTIMIVITRGFILRNVLRSGLLDLLKAKYRVVILLATKKDQPIPQELRDEFEDKNVSLHGIAEPKMGGLFDRLYRFVSRWTFWLVYTRSGWVFSRIGNFNRLNRAPIWQYVEYAIFSVLTRIDPLKHAARWVEKNMFRHDCYGALFAAHKPDVVFSTSIVSKMDIVLMKEAQRRGIKTVSMPKGWDNITKGLYHVVPDKLIVQNPLMRQGAVKQQLIPSEKIAVCGFSQFDWYRKPEILLSREEYCSRVGLNPVKKIIFFGSEGAWAPHDDDIAQMLAQMVNTDGLLATPAQLFVRPHFTDVKKRRFDRLADLENVVVDESITVSDVLHCNWDPKNEETILFANLLHHCDLLVNVASTLTLDAACFDKPIISVAFGTLFHPRTGQDVSHLYYEMDHYADVLKTKAVDLVHSQEALLAAVNQGLLHPERKREERKRLIADLCYKVDGQSSSRMFAAIDNLVKEH